MSAAEELEASLYVLLTPPKSAAIELAVTSFYAEVKEPEVFDVSRTASISGKSQQGLCENTLFFMSRKEGEK